MKHLLIKFLLSIIFLASSGSGSELLKIEFAEDTLAQSHGEIIFSSVLFSHGENIDCSLVPFNASIPENFQEGTGGLTKVGERQSYDLGKWYRARYFKLLNLEDGFDPNLIQVSSINTDRALRSAKIFLAALYSSQSAIDDSLERPPVPVNTNVTDYLLSAEYKCNKYVLEKLYWTKSPEAQAFYIKYEEVIQFVCKNVGLSKEDCSIHDVFAVANRFWHLYNALKIMTSYHLNVPEWTKDIFPEPIYTLAEYYLSSLTFSTEMKRLRGGPLLKDMTQKMEIKKDTKFDLNLHVISAHQTTVAILLNSLGVYNHRIPDSASSVMIELRKKDSEFYVTILYRNSTQDHPYYVQVPGCDYYCTLDDFIKATKYLIVKDYNQECGTDISSPESINNIGGSITIKAMAFIGILLISVIILFTYKKYRIKRRYDEI